MALDKSDVYETVLTFLSLGYENIILRKIFHSPIEAFAQATLPDIRLIEDFVSARVLTRKYLSP